MICITKVIDFIKSNPNCGLWTERGEHTIHIDQDDGRSSSIQISLLMKNFLCEKNIFLKNFYAGFKPLSVRPVNTRKNLNDSNKIINEFNKTLAHDKLMMQHDLSLLVSIKSLESHKNLSRMIRDSNGKICLVTKKGIKTLSIGTMNYQFQSWKDERSYFQKWVLNKEMLLVDNLFSKY